MVRCWRSFSAAVVMTMLAVAPPAEAVPTGTYADRGTLRVVAAPGDRAVQVAVEQFDGGEAPGPGSYTDVVGHVRLTADVPCGGPGDDILGNGRLIVGGSGRDVITAGWQTLRIRAADGEADSVTCLSGRTVVHADPVDRVSGCRVVLR
jgi:hypothetical protein